MCVAHLAVTLLIIVRLVAPLVAGVGILLIGSWRGSGGGGFLLSRWSSHEGGDDARLLENEPQVSHPKDHIDEAECLHTNEGGASLAVVLVRRR